MLGTRYDRQFKLAAAKLVPDEEMPVRQISEEPEVPDNTLRRRSAEYEKCLSTKSEFSSTNYKSRFKRNTYIYIGGSLFKDPRQDYPKSLSSYLKG